MDELRGDLDALDEDVRTLETTLGQAGDATGAFLGEIEGFRRTLLFTGREVEGLSRSIGFGLRRAVDGLVFDGARLSDVLRGLGASVSRAAFNVAFRPVQDAFGSAVAGGANAFFSGIFGDGAAFGAGRVRAFAQGGVVSGATAFPLRGGVGLMGEAGPEAILPLARGADGRLGVASAGGGGAVNVTVNVSTPDVAGFRRSQGQIAAELGRALARGQRNR